MTENEQLSDRELELLQLVATGASNKEIAQKLSISPNTVKVHLRNIFTKTGVVSRTEATLYAFQHGLVAVNHSIAVQPISSEISRATETTQNVTPNGNPDTVAPTIERSINPIPITRRVNLLWFIGPLVVLVILIISFAFFMRRSPAIVSASPVAPVASARWQLKSPMPTSRSGLAAASYENRIYTIGGETETTITSTVEYYDPIQDAWTTLQPKPVAVTDVSAAVIGGKIYVPGGRLENGSMTSVCEVYDPKENRWSRVASLPNALSGYAMVSFEGKLYLFGGFDGQKYLNTVFAYDPGLDEWTARSPMPTIRAFAGATIVGGKIYILGGYDGGKILATAEEYLPERDNGKDDPWARRLVMPIGRYAMGVTSIADIIHIVGGIGETGAPLPPVEYLYQQDRWQEFDVPPLSDSWSNLTLTPIETYLYALGGKVAGKPVDTNLAFRAIYTIIVPTIR